MITEANIKNFASYKWGMQDGLAQGIEKGIEQSIEKGIEKGIEQGRLEEKKTIAHNLLARGLDRESISEIINFETLDSGKEYLTTPMISNVDLT